MGYSVQQTSEEDILLLVTFVDFGNGGDDLYLIKTDDNGNELGIKYLGTNDDFGYSVQQTTDGVI